MTLAQKGTQALEFASRGWPVFPLIENSKEPKTIHGFKDATVDEYTIRCWWSKFPDANIGIATGQQSGLFVVDIDKKNGVDGNQAADEFRLTECSTYTVKTPNGFHLYFKYPDTGAYGCAVAARPGLDIRANGGYVVAPGSIIDEKEYTISLNESVQDVPSDVLKLCPTRQEKTIQSVTSAVEIGTGTRNNELTAFAGIMRNAGASQTQIEAALLVKNSEECRPPLSEDEVKRIARSIARYEAGQLSASSIPQDLQLVSWQDFRIMDLPLPEFALKPVLPVPGLLLLHAWTGLGKTNLVIHMALAAASGKRLMQWEAGQPAEVAFLDGEMTAATLRDRMLLAEKSLGPLKSNVHIATPDLNLAAGRGMPDLGTTDGQAAINAALPPTTKIIIVDNLSSWIRTGEENLAEFWLQVQPWALKHRANGRAVLFVDHDGKAGNSFRGTSKKADVMDTVLHLKRPDDYDPTDGARFIVHTTKSRLVPALPDFEARLEITDKGAVWQFETVETRAVKAQHLKEAGLTVREIAKELGVSVGTVSNDLKSDEWLSKVK